MNDHDPLIAALPTGIRSHYVDGVNGLRMHVLEAGSDDAHRPCVLLLHGFPELAFSWRKVIMPLVEAGYRVIAPDQRGYGRTTGWDDAYDADLSPFRFLSLVRDVMRLLSALGIDHVKAVVGHDFGASVAAYAALVRPDIFRSMVLMSAPFGGPPALGALSAGNSTSAELHAALGELDPPRKHYHWYYCTPDANPNMWKCPQGVHDFMRAYFHVKSADWTDNKPRSLGQWSAETLAALPNYYIMRRELGMAENAALAMPSPQAIANCQWLPNEALRVYSTEYGRTGFQGGLNWYRCRGRSDYEAELQLFAGRTIDVPSCFISGKQDWGVQQTPGALEAMESKACTHFRGTYVIDGAGHWVQQEQPKTVVILLVDFLAETS